MGTCLVVELAGDVRTAVLRLWADLGQQWGLGRAHPSGDPHLTLAVLRGEVEPGRILTALEPIARRSAPFRTTGAGYGVFVGHGNSPVLHLAVTRAPRLSALHQAVVNQLDALDIEVEGEYQPEHWRPHITLADRGLTPAVTGQAMAFLVASGPRHWTVTVDNLALLTAAGGESVRLDLSDVGGVERRDVRL